MVLATFTSHADTRLQDTAEAPGAVPGDIRVAAHGSIPLPLILL